MIFVDQELARRLEYADALAGVEYARSWASRHSHVGSFALAVGGGHAGFAGVDSPVTQAFGLGLNGPVTEADFDALEDFYRTFGSPVNIETCPFADASLLKLLTERGYRPIEYSNVLARRLTADEARWEPDGKGAATIRRPDGAEVEKVTITLLKSFFEGAEITPELLDIFGGLFDAKGSTCLMADIGGEIAGAAMVGVFDGVATLGGAGTLPEFRGRGVQSALIAARVAFAAQQGCDLAMVATNPGSGSQRNVERQGFRVVYTRSKFLREWK